MELRHLRYFITVAEELNFSKAALKLYTAQPSLSQQIKDLEQDVGVQLLYRTKRKVELTEEGAVFLEQARLTLAQADKAVAMARQVLHAKQQTLSVGFMPIVEIEIFPKILPNLRIQIPDLKIKLLSLNSYQQIQALKKGELDVTFTGCNLNDDLIESRFVLREPLTLLLPTHHPLAQYACVPIQALDGINFILPTIEHSLALHQGTLAFAKAHSIRLNVVQKVDSLALLSQAMLSNLAGALVPSHMAPLLAENTVIRALDVQAPTIAWYVNYHKQSRSVAANKFIKLLTSLSTADVEPIKVAQV